MNQHSGRPSGNRKMSKNSARRYREWQKRRRRQNMITIAAALLVLFLIGLIIFWISGMFTRHGDPSDSGPSSSDVSSDVLPESSGESSGTAESSSDISSEPAVQMTTRLMTRDDLSKGDLILVNFDNSYMEEPPALEKVYDHKTGDYAARDKEIQLRDYVIAALNEMMADFRAETGITNVVALSCYRSVEYQRGLYERDLERTGRNYSDSVTKPGYSEHHTGLTFDLAYIAEDGSWPFYDGHGDYGWVNENCWRYGFIVRYTEDKQDITQIIAEPWHFRYLGPAHAEMIVKSGFCLEEYIEMLKKHPPENPYEFEGETGSWSVYYVPLKGDSMEVPVPKDKPYTVSGSNEGGFIITVDESGQNR